DYDSYYYWGSSPRVQALRMEVTANDGSNQTVTGVYYFSVYAAAEQLSLQTGGYFAEPGQPFTVTARAMDLFDQPISGSNLTLTTSAWDRQDYEFNHVDQTLHLQTDPQGIAKQDVQLSAGYHELTLKGEDSHGNDIEVKHWIYVFRSKQ